jgi:Asp-tRNA(Asn)/Glu-tRNA(Gln) amidotransferase A subunit family amidase
VKHDVVVVVPVTPSPPPRIDAPAPLLHSWLSRCHAFAALTALGGVPSVVVPVGQLPKNGGPLSVALFGHSRSDQRLLTVAERLASQAQVCRFCLRGGRGGGTWEGRWGRGGGEGGEGEGGGEREGGG